MGETLINISKDLKNCAGKVNIESQTINSSLSIDDKLFTSILAYIRDINACVVFFTFVMSAVLFFLARKNGLEDNNSFNDITLKVSYLVGWLPSLVLLIKLINEAAKKRGWKAAGFLIAVFIVSFIMFLLLEFSLYKLIYGMVNELHK